MVDDDKATPADLRARIEDFERAAWGNATRTFYGDTTPGALHFYTPSNRFRGWLADCLRDIADWIDG